jgi:septation ring formation regulator EzrA
MIADLRRVVQVLDCDVQTEEERSRIFGRSNAHYPMLARTLAARRANLKATIAALEARLSSIGTQLSRLNSRSRPDPRKARKKARRRGFGWEAWGTAGFLARSRR